MWTKTFCFQRLFGPVPLMMACAVKCLHLYHGNIFFKIILLHWTLTADVGFLFLFL